VGEGEERDKKKKRKEQATGHSLLSIGRKGSDDGVIHKNAIEQSYFGDCHSIIVNVK
jgi:hypothetical protein